MTPPSPDDSETNADSLAYLQKLREDALIQYKADELAEAHDRRNRVARQHNIPEDFIHHIPLEDNDYMMGRKAKKLTEIFDTARMDFSKMEASQSPFDKPKSRNNPFV